MIPRTPEPELMEDKDQAAAYAAANFGEVNIGFLEKFIHLFPDFQRGNLLDIGCGPGDIVYRFLAKYPQIHIFGVDGSQAMLELAEKDERSAKYPGRAQWRRCMLGDLPAEGGRFDAIISNSLLHHLPDPSILWSSIPRLALPGAAVLVMDLFRPKSEEAARDIVEKNAARESSILKHDFFQSLLAAFTKEEVEAQLERSGLGHFSVEIVSERHLMVWGRV